MGEEELDARGDGRDLGIGVRTVVLVGNLPPQGTGDEPVALAHRPALAPAAMALPCLFTVGDILFHQLELGDGVGAADQAVDQRAHIEL